jgi:hypothetical protein
MLPEERFLTQNFVLISCFSHLFETVKAISDVVVIFNPSQCISQTIWLFDFLQSLSVEGIGAI